MREDSYSRTLRENLRSIRKAKGLTTSDVAKILGVSQAKISYIETGRGVLSARDVAVLARHLDIPVVDFFRGLEYAANATAQAEIANQLAHFGASHLAKPAGVPLSFTPFEEVFTKSLSFLEDDRLHKAFCAAWILEAQRREINVSRILALTANNPFLLKKVQEEARICLDLIKTLNRSKTQISPRAKRQIEKLLSATEEIATTPAPARLLSSNELEDLADFVGECLDAKS